VIAPATGSTYGTPLNDQIKQLVDLLNQADVEQDPAKLAQLYQQAQDPFANDAVTIPLYFVAEHVVYRSNIHGSSAYATPETLNIGPHIEFNYATLSKTPSQISDFIEGRVSTCPPVFYISRIIYEPGC
jgi:ABC-type transport system substrate-binding protein